MSEVYGPAAVRKPLGPDEDIAGPALTPLVYELRRVVNGLDILYARARQEAQLRPQIGVAQANTDANGDALLKLFEVPQGATAYLMLCAIDQAGVDPGSPQTSATMWHAIYGAGAGVSAAGVVAVGNLMDARPNAPTIDAQIPFAYVYASHYGAPTLIGPATFYVVIDGAGATRQVAARFVALVEQPEP
jgi:hypothetical protein